MSLYNKGSSRGLSLTSLKNSVELVRHLYVGLEAKLVFAIGACVMLRRNIDTSIGLVNGAIGTVLSISKEQIKVKFDHISAPYDVERVHSKFMVMKYFYVYRQQFPLILAYAITIHKSRLIARLYHS